jgi:hypothetical protein
VEDRRIANITLKLTWFPPGSNGVTWCSGTFLSQLSGQHVSVVVSISTHQPPSLLICSSGEPLCLVHSQWDVLFFFTVLQGNGDLTARGVECKSTTQYTDMIPEVMDQR